MEAPLLQVQHRSPHVASMIFKEAQLPGAMPAGLLEAGQLRQPIWTRLKASVFGIRKMHAWSRVAESYDFTYSLISDA